jgi:predicted component of type VI protein secretion system
MEDDNLMPNDGTYFGIPVEPVEQTVARKKEKAKTLEAKAEIERVIKHFEERIKYRDTLDSLNVSAINSPEMHLRACVTNDMLKMALIEEKQLLEELLDIHSPNR